MYYTQERIKRIVDELEKYIYTDSEMIPSFKFKRGHFHGGEKPGLDISSWDSFVPGKDRWGERDAHYWFRTEVSIPDRFEGKTVLFDVRTGKEGEWDALNPQFHVYVDGSLIQGLDVNHREIILSESAKSGDRYDIALYAYSGMKDGLLELIPHIKVLDRKIEKLYYDIKVPYEIAGILDADDKKSIDILNMLNDAINMLDLRKPFSEAFNKSVVEAGDFLDREFYGKFCGSTDAEVACVGHTHIDVAWLWTIAQTREKVQRSFSTVLSLMKQYPEYIFMSSQPQLYKFIKEDAPELYTEIKKRISEGRWEPEGGMWLEADCNLASGESLVRQLLFGLRFFEKEFGVKNRILWLPDVFGYSAALPQILKKCGIDYFMTTKIGWNEYNKFPYDTFKWRGMDGSEVLTHFITAKHANSKVISHMTTYNAFISPSQVIGAWQRYQQKNINNEVLISFGHGDGGGGPTKEMLENARRMEKGIPGCPRTKMSTSLDFFKRLEEKVASNKKLPKWVGELYLEYHRGTYTSMARNKRYNRKSEFLYQDIELLSVMNNILVGAGYPQDSINKGWETVLLNQFHDILPGSSIKEVYEDSKLDYIKLAEEGGKLVDEALSGVASGISLDETSVVVFNQLGFDRTDVVEFELPEDYENAEIYDGSGKQLASQTVEGGKVLFTAENVPAKGYKAFSIRKPAAASSVFESGCPKADIGTLDNSFFNIKFGRDASIVSIYDKVNDREVLMPGERANVLQAFEDKPHKWDAWDINLYYQEKMWELDDVESAEVVENGPVRASLRIRRKFLDSTVEQDIRIYSDIARIDFATRIDWKERQILLKAAFPVDVHTEKATYEIQYGNVERPTHWNTSWDYARFEVCAHKWADLSEDNYGVSLLNDCKYGHDIKDGVMRLTLLKSATYPNEAADKEFHEFTYSLYPHAAGWKEAGTVEMAYALNCPMYAKVEDAHKGELPVSASLISSGSANVVVEAVKKAEDSDDLIVRVYECHNRRTRARLSFFKELGAVRECDLLEQETGSVAHEGKSFEFIIQPYEIKTFKLTI